MREFGLFIDGAFRAPRDGHYADTLNPATGEPWARVACASVADVGDAVVAATRAHRAGVWRSLPREERAAVLERIAAGIFESQADLAAAEVQDGGGTIRKANTADVPATAQTFMHFAALLRSSPEEEEHEEFVPVPSKNILRREPMGVCACIVPFNFPLAAASWKVAPALAAGNTIVLKPSPYTPVTALMLADICTKAGVPPGVLNVITGPGAEIGEALVAHPDVAKVAFTGSTVVGQRVMETAARGVKSVTLELGGKSPNIVLEDANLDGAVPGALFGTFFHQGQVCESGTRLLVHQSIHDQFLERMVAEMRRLVPGDTLDPATTLGALISESQRARTEEYVAAGKAEGARVVTGGKRPAGFERGYWYEPTIFADADNGMRIAREEIFGPVVSVIPFRDDAEAIAIANDTMYGLGAAVWSRDRERALGMARQIDAGTVWINDYHLLNVRFPFGGYKQSGFGRELGAWGLAEYQQVKHIHVGEPTGAAEKFYFGMLLAD
jgi:aldehyde dehydrogenase (NAD+)